MIKEQIKELLEKLRIIKNYKTKSIGTSIAKINEINKIKQKLKELKPLLEKEIEELKKFYICPKCKKIFESVDGLCVVCECGFVDDSNFNQITNFEKLNELKQLKEKVDDVLN